MNLTTHIRHMLSLVALFFASQSLFGQSPLYMEPAGNGEIRFYFDERYYFVDRDCEFRAIERIGKINPETQLFDGPFIDYNYRGQLILSGHYTNGIRNGDFKAYHGNGQLKWEVRYENGEPVGLWKYYYPDGKPMVYTEYSENAMLIKEYWDQSGKHQVKNGNGKYEMKLELDGYSPYGIKYIVRKGRIKNGLQHGFWALQLIYGDDSKENMSGQIYRDGILVSDPEYSMSMIPQGASRIYLTPIPWFLRAEELIGKGCTIEEHEGFTEYITLYLEEYFKGFYISGFEPIRAEFDITVSKEGKLLRLEPKNDWVDLDFLRMIRNAIQLIDFWFPSYNGQEFVEDTQRLSFDIYSDNENRVFHFFDAKIQPINK